MPVLLSPGPSEFRLRSAVIGRSAVDSGTGPLETVERDGDGRAGSPWTVPTNKLINPSRRAARVTSYHVTWTDDPARDPRPGNL